MSLAIPYRHDVTWYLLGTGMTHMVCSVLIFSRETLVLRGKAKQLAVGPSICHGQLDQWWEF